MIKSTILSILSIFSIFTTLVVSSALPQSGQNQTLDTTSERGFPGLGASPAIFKYGSMKINLWHYSYYRGYQGSFTPEPNRCYAAPDFTSVRISATGVKRVAFMACRDKNCSTDCYTFINPGIQIDDVWWYVNKGYSKSYAWIV
ncbi:hypothetical protein AX774_g1885 [Zancudomyces culisetae]|uniref:Uncharacterized protein n=1 Tax=Zancudomyces culisetae TaxID=1213189 RepID=A0A1R1PUG9_ZANCU|nr:hypothetical protein AX774_g1885 [Zancudomyces culisetae]|eukprot:OMH84587.1 hypothetical protein AX774_g1885 [Zancudomyces culisetae]